MRRFRARRDSLPRLAAAVVAAGAALAGPPSGWRVVAAVVAAVLLAAPVAPGYQVIGGLLVIGGIALHPQHDAASMLAAGVSAAGLVMVWGPPRRHAAVELAVGGGVAVLVAAAPRASADPAAVAGLVAAGLLMALVGAAARPQWRAAKGGRPRRPPDVAGTTR